MSDTETSVFSGDDGNGDIWTRVLLLELTPEYFEHPLTTERFDRTPEQRAERTEILAGLLNNTGFSHEEAQAEANRKMFARFGEKVAELVDEKAQWYESKRLKEDGEEMSQASIGLARAAVSLELEKLHEALPLPGLDRLVQQEIR